MTNEVEKLRQRLIDLELRTRDNLDAVQAKRTKAQQFIDRANSMDAEAQRQKLHLQRARRELAAAEQREASREQANRVYDELGNRADNLRAQMAEFDWGQTLLAHQPFAIVFGAVAKRWICGDEMGLGKTRESIGYLDLVQAKRVLIVCEANICSQFAGEVEAWSDRAVFDIAKSGPVRRAQLLDELFARDDGVLVANYEIFRSDKTIIPRLHDWRLDTVIVDEAHNLKTTSTANYRYLSEIIEANNTCPQCGGLIVDTHQRTSKGVGIKKLPCSHCGWIWSAGNGSLDGKLATRSVKNVMLTTGTPILNTPMDLYSLLHLVDPALFRAASEFQAAYCQENYWTKKIEWAPGGMDRLAPLIAGRYLARSLEDAGVELPEQRIHIVPVDLDPRQYPRQTKAIKQISETAELVLDNGETLTIMHLMSLITRKRQANVWADGIKWVDATTKEVLFETRGEINESAKIDALVAEIQEQMALGRRQIVFSQFATALSEVEKRLTALDIRAVRFDGSTPDKIRLAVKSNFDITKGETPKWDVVLANYKTGGSGLNLTAATVTHILDEEWNPGKRNQAYARNHRIGQCEETDVFVYRMSRTVDTWMAALIRHKEQMVRGFSATTNLFSQKALRDAMKNGDVL